MEYALITPKDLCINEMNYSQTNISSKMLTSGDSFYLTLPSNSNTHNFPENNGGHYKTILANEICLSSEWEVGLSEIIYVSESWDNVRNGENTIEFTTRDPATLNGIKLLNTSMKDVVFWKNAMPVDKLHKIEINCRLESSTDGDELYNDYIFWKYDGIKESYILKELINEIEESIKESILKLDEEDRFDFKFKKINNYKGEIEIKRSNASKRVLILFSENFQKLFGLDTENIGFLNTESFKVEFKMFDLLKYYDNKNFVKYSIVIEPKNYDTLESLF
jgi:hypothetical protein